MVRDAGTVTFEGQLNDSGGSGRFTFESNPDYLAALAKMGYATPMADEAFALAVHDVSRKFMGELASLGYYEAPARRPHLDEDPRRHAAVHPRLSRRSGTTTSPPTISSPCASTGRRPSSSSR